MGRTLEPRCPWARQAAGPATGGAKGPARAGIALALVKKVNHPKFGLLVDLGNWNAGEDRYAAMRVTNSEPANRRVDPPYRSGYAQGFVLTMPLARGQAFKPGALWAPGFQPASKA